MWTVSIVSPEALLLGGELILIFLKHPVKVKCSLCYPSPSFLEEKFGSDNMSMISFFLDGINDLNSLSL